MSIVVNANFACTMSYISHLKLLTYKSGNLSLTQKPKYGYCSLCNECYENVGLNLVYIVIVDHHENLVKVLM